MELFEFSEQWNTGYFIGMMLIAFIETALIKKAIKCRDNRKTKGYRNWLALAFVLLVFFETFRTIDTGTDTVDYVGFFQHAVRYGYKYLMRYKWEPLFTIYVFLISRISNIYNILFFINGTIGTYAFLKYVTNQFKQNSTYMFLPLFILNYSYNLSSMRSSLGTAFLLLSIVEFEKEKNAKAIIYSIMATMFHYSFIFQVCFIIYQIYLRSQIRRVSGTRLILFSLMMFGITYSSTHFLQRVFINTKYVEYTRKMGTGWLGQWNIILAGIISLYIIMKRRGSVDASSEVWNTDEILNIMNVAFLPYYVRLNVYRVPTYYLLCRIATYSRFSDMIRKSQSSSGKWMLKIIEFSLTVFGMLFYASRLRTGMDYTFIWNAAK